MQPEDDEGPSHIAALYEKPQDEWSADEWRTLALHLFSMMQESRTRADALIELLQQSQDTAASALEQARRRSMSFAKLARVIEGALESGDLKLTDRPAPRKAGRPKKRFDEADKKFQAGALVLASRYGTTKAAELLATWEFRKKGKSPVVNRKAFEQRAKSLANDIGRYKRFATQEIWQEHGEGLAAIDALMKLGLHKPSKRPRKALLSPKKS